MNKYYNEIKDLRNKFEQIKSMGWIESKGTGLGSIGITFEKLIGNDKNELEIPDYKGIEIKTKHAYSKSYTSLFNAVPDGPHYHEVERLKQLYGYPDSKLKQFKVLNTSVYAIEKTKVGMNFYFKLKVDNEKKKILLTIFDKNKNMIENYVY